MCQFFNGSSSPVANTLAHGTRDEISAVNTPPRFFWATGRNWVWATYTWKSEWVFILDSFFLSFRDNTAKGTSSPDSAMAAPIGCVPCVNIATNISSIPASQAVSTLAAVTMKLPTINYQVGSEDFDCDLTESIFVEPIKFVRNETVLSLHVKPGCQPPSR